MTRLTRLTAILAKIETTYGTDSVPTGADNALLVSAPTLSHVFNNVARDNIKAYLGADEELVGTRSVSIGFDVEISGSGTAGTAPAWGPLLRGCAMAQTVTAGQRVEYNPISTGFESLTICYHRDGVLHKATGCRGTVEFMMEEGTIPKMRFAFTGLDAGPSAVSNPVQTLTPWRVPQVVTAANSAAVKLGATYSAGALSGGTDFCSRGLMLNLGNEVTFSSMLGPCTRVDIQNRAATGSLQLDLDAAAEVTQYGAINANTLTSVGLLHGSSAGNRVLVFAPAVQRINPTQADFNGRVQIGMDLRVLPVSGNDELRIVAL
jgi:hypothetical protein